MRIEGSERSLDRVTPTRRDCDRRARTLSAIVALAVLAGCAATPPPRPQMAVLSSAQAQELAQQTAPYRAAGSGVITGQVTLDTTRGRVVAGEGTPVMLTPSTSYTLAQFQQYAVESDQLPPQAPDQLTWTTKTDAFGHFTLSGLPPGDYLLVSPVSWNELGPASLLVTNVATATVHLGPGASAQAQVTRKVMIELNT